MESSDWTQDGVGVAHRHAGRHWNWALGGGCARTWDCKAHNPSTRPGHLIAAHTLHNRPEHISLCKCAGAHSIMQMCSIHKHIYVIMVVQDAAIRRFYSELLVIVIYTRNYWFKIGATHMIQEVGISTQNSSPFSFAFENITGSTGNILPLPIPLRIAYPCPRLGLIQWRESWTHVTLPFSSIWPSSEVGEHLSPATIMSWRMEILLMPCNFTRYK